MIVTHLMQISPSELENALVEDPLLLEACVVGAPHNDGTADDVVAFVTTKKSGMVTEQYVKDIIKNKFCEWKHLTKVVVMDVLPKNVNSKIDSRKLQQIAVSLTLE